MQSASTAAELESAIQQGGRDGQFVHSYRGQIWNRICKLRVEAGKRICVADPNGRFVPQIGARHVLTVCEDTYKVGYGQNSTGVRYCWHYAMEWTYGVLIKNGLTRRAAYEIYDCAFDYPHRSLAIVYKALAGELPDPRFNRLRPRNYSGGSPVKMDRRKPDGRAHRSCRCDEGWLWDWGGGWNGYANFINWRCDRCPLVCTEYVTTERLYEIRNGKARYPRVRVS